MTSREPGGVPLVEERSDRGPGGVPLVEERSDRGPGGVPLVEEVAALVAVVSVLEAERAAAATAAPRGPGDELKAWVAASRLSARRGSFTRGSWRLAGRLARRARA